jgi:hypothetical protein
MILYKKNRIFLNNYTYVNLPGGSIVDSQNHLYNSSYHFLVSIQHSLVILFRGKKWSFADMYYTGRGSVFFDQTIVLPFANSPWITYRKDELCDNQWMLLLAFPLVHFLIALSCPSVRHSLITSITPSASIDMSFPKYQSIFGRKIFDSLCT